MIVKSNHNGTNVIDSNHFVFRKKKKKRSIDYRPCGGTLIDPIYLNHWSDLCLAICHCIWLNMKCKNNWRSTFLKIALVVVLLDHQIECFFFLCVSFFYIWLIIYLRRILLKTFWCFSAIEEEIDGRKLNLRTWCLSHGNQLGSW